MSGFVENLDVPYISPIILLYSVYFFKSVSCFPPEIEHWESVLLNFFFCSKSDVSQSQKYAKFRINYYNPYTHSYSA